MKIKAPFLLIQAYQYKRLGFATTYGGKAQQAKAK